MNPKTHFIKCSNLYSVFFVLRIRYLHDVQKFKALLLWTHLLLGIPCILTRSIRWQKVIYILSIYVTFMDCWQLRVGGEDGRNKRHRKECLKLPIVQEVKSVAIHVGSTVLC